MLLGTGKPRKTCVEVAGRRTFRIPQDLLGPSKRRSRRVCRDPAPSDTPSHSEIDLAVPFADNSTKGDEEQDAVVCSVLVVSLKTTMEKTRYNASNISDGHSHFVLV